MTKSISTVIKRAGANAVSLVARAFLAAGFAFAAQAAPGAFRDALTFHASFDRGVDADFAAGDGRLYHAPATNKRVEAAPGLPPEGTVALAAGKGRFGGALQFKQKNSPVIFFRAETNVAYARANWSGTVSFWLSLDPDADLKPGYADPIQITERGWNDAAFFVEFGKEEKPRPFRLGVYADFKVWNPENRPWEKIPAHEKPLVAVEKPPFQRGKWTHVVFTFQDFNTGRADGVARLYLDGEFQGLLTPRTQTFTWEPSKAAVMMGLSYIGLFDELTIFNRAFTETEVKALHRLEKGVGALLPAARK